MSSCCTLLELFSNVKNDFVWNLEFSLKCCLLFNSWARVRWWRIVDISKSLAFKSLNQEIVKTLVCVPWSTDRSSSVYVYVCVCVCVCACVLVCLNRREGEREGAVSTGTRIILYVMFNRVEKMEILNQTIYCIRRPEKCHLGLLKNLWATTAVV